MKILKKLLLILAVVFAAVFVYSLFLPSKGVMESSMRIHAPASVVFPYVNTLKNWEKWSPWQKMDTNMKLTYEGPEAGVGAKYNWKSENKNVGFGSLSITESIPNQKIVTQLNFGNMSPSFGGFDFKEEGGETVVRWYMNMDMGLNPIGKIMMPMINKQMASVFDEGLLDIKKLAEADAAKGVAPTPDSTGTHQ